MIKVKYKKLNIKGALLDKTSLCNYLEKLASEQQVKDYSDENTYPIKQLKDDFETIYNTYSLLNQNVKLKINIEPAGEWILDNFYAIEETTKFIEKELTSKKYRNLYGVANGKYSGFARIFVLAEEIIAYTDGKIEEEAIKNFLMAYQRKRLLTMEEIWSLPIFLKIAIIQNIRDICEKIYLVQMQKLKVENIIERLIDKQDKTKYSFDRQPNFAKKKNVSMSYTFIEYLSYKLKSYGKKGIPYLNILEDQVNRMGLTISDAIKQAHFLFATNKVSMGNLVTSLKEIMHIDFSEMFEQASGIEKLLLKDPAKVYEKMDYKTKNDYKNKIREISKIAGVSEIYITNVILELCEKNKNGKKSHIGYYLFEDVNLLYKKLEINYKETSKEKKTALYMATTIILPLYICLIFYSVFFIRSNNFILSAFSSILLYLPITEIVLQLLMYTLSKIVKPKRIPKLDLSMGVPKEAGTFIVIPSILENEQKVKELVHKLEIYYLANKSNNLYFAILGDVTASDKKDEENDKNIIAEGVKQISELNKKYNQEKFSRFHFLYRKRYWNPQEACFLGWERKRGLLVQFNEFLLNPNKDDFKYNSIANQVENKPFIKYVITLDSDTNLVLNSGLELIGAMEHILNTPEVENGIVTSGHAIIQPRIGVDLSASYSSYFSNIYAGIGGTDFYTNAISDVYQDNFDEGIFAGKGIYNLEIFSQIITNQIPDNTVLSHDLLEGSYLRCGLASDILLLDGFPSKYNSYMTRLSRWIRGDWQILKWITSKITIRNGTTIINPLRGLSKYKILDNLRRSITSISILIIILFGMLRHTTPDGFLIFIGLTSISMPAILSMLDRIVFKKELENGFEIANKNFESKVSGLTGTFYQTALELAFLPYKAYISIMSIAKTIYRMYISKQKLLEWITAEQAEKQAITSRFEYYKLMYINILLGLLILVFSMKGNMLQIILGFLIGMLWLLGPGIACSISKHIENRSKPENLEPHAKEHLMEIAKKTWEYFSNFANEQNNFLIPDNYEEYRKNKIAPRTSPTNIGLELMSIISAVDLNFISKGEALMLISKCINTINILSKWNGHLYNWYNTETLEPLNPKYISTVDSGNFICYLYVLKQFLLSIQDEKLKEKANNLVNTIDDWVKNADFSKLFNPKKKLLSIGYNLEEERLTDSYYDLLASEARQTSLIAIAKRDIPAKHWNALSRTLTVFKKYKGLVSWSGTSFEYLMANMIIRNYPGSLLQESSKFMVFCQREYCRQLGIPWGISEAAFSLKDLNGNYQYKAFGISWLGLKRGLAEDRVVSSYGSVLALADCPNEVVKNIKKLEDEKMMGTYGLYESIDYTPTRLKANKKNEVVKTFMAHHQGLILMAINNFFNDNVMVDRFMKNPEIEALDILLQERMPQVAILTNEKKERIEKIYTEGYETYSRREYTKPSNELKRINVLSNDKYSVCIDDRGCGYSKYQDMLVNKYKESSDEEQGIFFYIKNLKNNKIWTTGNLKKSNKPDKYKVVFTPDHNMFSRTDGNIETKETITISPTEPIEIRCLELKNTGLTEETLEITSIIDPALCNSSQEYAHPAFNNLFLEYEWLELENTIIIKRRKRDSKKQDMYMGACMYTEYGQVGDTEYEINKSELIGRNNISIPIKIRNSKPFTNKIENNPENIAGIRQTVKIKPNEKTEIVLLIGLSDTRENLKKIISKYKKMEEIERTLELAKAKSEAENRYLSIQAKDTDLYQKMLGYLLFDNPLMSNKKDYLPKCSYPIEDLWSIGISGDFPILLVKIKDPNDSYILKRILKAKEFFMLKNCDVDIVILNEEKNIYEQYVKEKIENYILENHLAYLINQRNGIFVINSWNLEQKQRDSLIFRSNLYFDAGKGNLEEQIEELEEAYLENQQQAGFDKKVEEIETNKSRINLEINNLEYYNGYGGFDINDRKYVFKISNDATTPTVWSHILANKHFGTIITESMGGYTWSKNSRLNRISSWNNVPYLDIPSEILYFKDKETGKVWSNSSFIAKEAGDFKVEYGFGYGTYTNLYNDFFCETTIFVPKEDSIKVMIIKMKNIKQTKRSIKAIYYIKPVLGEDESITKGYLDLSKKSNHSLEMKNLGENVFRGVTIVGTSEKIESFTGDKNSFIGAGNILRPDGVDKIGLCNENSIGKTACIAIETVLNFDEYETKEFCVFLGEAKNEEEAHRMENKYIDLQNCYNELTGIKNYWFETLSLIQVDTPVKSMNIMINGWLLYQTISSRLFAKSGYYQSGGAFGFRDQLQDVLALKYTQSNYLKDQILKASRHQFEEGDVEHWWHEETNKGIRTRFSDDLLWLPFAVIEYIDATNDDSILKEEAEYLCGKELKKDMDECYDEYVTKGNKESVYKHCTRAIDKSISFGANGFPKIGSGDWNDGFSTVGNKGKGESVWLGFFLYYILTRFIPLCRKNEQMEKANYYELIAEGLKKSLNTKGWDGRWFKRAINDSGEILGSNESEECKIDSISQSWAILSEAGDNDKRFIAMESVDNYLVDTSNGIIKLLTPPFKNCKIEPGYIKSYMPGVRENGGQYTHAAAWVICALAKLGLGEKATKYFNMVNPIEHSKTKEGADKYKVEPYVVAGDVYGTGTLTGRGGWTWYTGSSSWLYQAGVEWILGLKIKNNELWLEPHISPEWKEYSIRYRYKESVYNIKVKNPNGYTSGVKAFKVNGKEIVEKKITLNEGKEYFEIEVEM